MSTMDCGEAYVPAQLAPSFGSHGSLGPAWPRGMKEIPIAAQKWQVVCAPRMCQCVGAILRPRDLHYSKLPRGDVLL